MGNVLHRGALRIWVGRRLIACQKNGTYHVRFRFGGRSYKRSLKTREMADAQDSLLGVKRLLHRLATGKASIPDGVDPGDFITSEGNAGPESVIRPPSLSDLSEAYLDSLQGTVADSYVSAHALNFIERVMATLYPRR